MSILSRICRWYESKVIFPLLGLPVADEPTSQAPAPLLHWAQSNTPFGGILNPVEMALNEREIVKLAAVIRQLKFLLANAPMMNAPDKYLASDWFRRVTTPFGYIHPKTMGQFRSESLTPRGVWLGFAGSPTKWVLTSLMPEGTILLTQTLGVEIE